MLTVVVLGSSYSEGRKFVTASGLGRKAFVPAGSGSMSGIRPDVILELPGYASRRDKHSFEAILRAAAYRRGPEVIRQLVSLDDLPVEPVPDPEALPGQTTIEDQVALAEADRMRRLSAFETTTPETSEAQHEANAPVATSETPKPSGYQPRSRAKSKKAT